MKIFLIWPGGSETEVIMDELVKAGHQIVYWVGETGLAHKLKGGIYHDHYAAWKGEPAEGVPFATFKPLSQSVIDSLSRTESLTLSMMNKRFNDQAVDERKNTYYEMASYWTGVLELYKPEAIVFNTVPHSVYSFVLYELAKRKGIQTIMFEDSWVSDRCLMYDDYEIGSRKLLTAKERNSGREFTLDDLEPDLRRYYEEKVLKRTDLNPLYMQIQRKQAEKWFGLPLHGIYKAIRQKAFVQAFKLYIRKKFLPNLRREYRSVQKEISLSSDYIYFPLSFQPERTSSPQSGIYVVQPLAIKTLSAALPKNWLIFIKEHPSQFMLRTKEAYSSARWKGYYESISRIENVRFVPIETDTFQLTERSKAVALVAGSAGFEAMLRGKAVINFGLPWYHSLDGVFNVNSVEDCEKALKKIAAGYTVDSPALIRNFKTLGDASFHGYTESFLERLSSLNREQSGRNLAKVTIDALKKK